MMNLRHSEAVLAEIASEAPEYTGLRAILDGAESASHAELDEAYDRLIGDMTMAEAESFGNILRTIGGVAQAALPMVGGLIGGPAGSAIGSVGSNILGGVLRATGGGSRRRSSTRRRTARRRTTRRTVRRGTGGSSASRQVAQLVQSPQFLQSLASIVGGLGGTESVVVAETEVPVSSVLNMFASLADRAAQEAAAYVGTTERIPPHLADAAEDADLSNPDERADILWRLFQEDGLLGATERFREDDFDADEFDDEFADYDDGVFDDEDDAVWLETREGQWKRLPH